MASSPIRIVVMGVRDPSNGADASARSGLVATSEFVLDVDRLTTFAEGETQAP